MTSADQPQGERCHHCGKPAEADGDHTCSCPLSDSECLEHTLNPHSPVASDALDCPKCFGYKTHAQTCEDRPAPLPSTCDMVEEGRRLASAASPKTTPPRGADDD